MKYLVGLTTISRNMIQDLGAGLKSIAGGEIKVYTKIHREDRDTAIDRLKSKADEFGADEIVMLRFDSGTIQSDM